MSEEEREAYNIAKKAYQYLKQKIETAIPKLNSIVDNIKELENSIKLGSIICSSVGWVSGVVAFVGILGVPFTFGGSLSLTAVGTGIGLCSGAADILQSWASNCGITTKCNEAMALLKVIVNLSTELAGLVENLYNIQNMACEMWNTSYRSFKAVCSLGAVTSKGCESMLTMMSKFGGKTTERVSAPIAGKVTTEVVKKSFRFVGTVAVGISVIADVVNIVNNVRALKDEELSVMVTGIQAAVTNMIKEKNRYDNMFADTA